MKLCKKQPENTTKSIANTEKDTSKYKQIQANTNTSKYKQMLRQYIQ